MKYYELIHPYLDGSLSESEKEAFEAEMKKDELLRNEVNLHREVDAALAETDILRLRSQLKRMHRKASRSRDEVRILSLRPLQAITAVAAVALLLVASAWIFTLMNQSSLSAEDIYEMYYQPDDAVMVMRSGSSGSEEAMLMEALRKYENNDFEGALKLLKKDNSNLMVHFYSGLAYMEIEHFNEAIRSFQTILDDQQNLFVEQALWYQGLCYIKTGRTDKAKEVFGDLLFPGSAYKTRVEFILKNLKD
jgi:tetratricopeptide (TPR) repeat protein